MAAIVSSNQVQARVQDKADTRCQIAPKAMQSGEEKASGHQAVHTFKRCEHVKKSCDFSNIFKRGRKRTAKGASLFFLCNDLPYNRIGFAIKRGYGNAIERNRCKRLSREAYRLFPKKEQLPPPNGGHAPDGSAGAHYDMVLLVHSKGGTLKERQEQLSVLFRGLV